jgi:hypothetical protein
LTVDINAGQVCRTLIISDGIDTAPKLGMGEDKVNHSITEQRNEKKEREKVEKFHSSKGFKLSINRLNCALGEKQSYPLKDPNGG